MKAGKRAKKSSDEERSKKKKTKSGKRRRRDSSLSSSSSDSDYASRPRRKKPKKPEKRRKESKKGSKKKARKARYRSASSSSRSLSSRSCSTCGGRDSSSSERPTSPPARATRKLKLKERGRSKGRERGRSRGRSLPRRSDGRGSGSRHRSQSCSSCSRSSGRSRRRGRSQSFSEERFNEMGRPRHLRTAQASYRVSEEIGERISSRDERRDKVIQACDGVLPRSRGGYDAGRKRDACRQISGEKGLVDTWVERGAYAKGEEAVSAKPETRPAKDDDDGNDNYAEKESAAVANTGGSEVDDLELLLRQKALENFRKFRGDISAKTRLDSDPLDDSVSTESGKDATMVIQAKDASKLSEWKPSSCSEDQGSIDGGSHPIRPRIRSVVHIPTENDDGNSVISRRNSIQNSRSVGDSTIDSANEGKNNQNQLKKTEETVNETSVMQNLLAGHMQDKVASKEPEGNTVHGSEVHKADGSASGSTACVNKGSDNEPIAEDAVGNQFQQKTFSRMHDGEMVQVSYKVYIPKKSPALSRRQLQR